VQRAGHLWSPEAIKAIAKYPMATFEKSYGMTLPDGKKQSEEIAGPEACVQVAKEGTGTNTFFYLNSVIDWPVTQSHVPSDCPF
jgi:hypothetical protein